MLSGAILKLVLCASAVKN